MLQTQDLRAGQANEPCIKLTQESLIESSVQDCLLYILKANSLCTTSLAYVNNCILALRLPYIYYNILSKSFYDILCVM